MSRRWSSYCKSGKEIEMKDQKLIENGFTWVPPEKRKSRFGGTVSPRIPEARLPMLWLARDGHELYLVNNSGATLDVVTAGTGGFQTVDDQVAIIDSREVYQYIGVSQGSSVKVDEYDICDSDFVLQMFLKIKSENFGLIEIRLPATKGGGKEMVLLWDSGEPGEKVQIEKIEQ
ncbi:MAG: hypothetical protein E6Q39_02015 [Crocinitomicaceae bacterium]|nr:MAG: hypothetical protein E6Q39_02015 [Crocinitomicaceae bacterium]